MLPFFPGNAPVLHEFEFKKCEVSSAFSSYCQSHRLSLCLFHEFQLPEGICVLG